MNSTKTYTNSKGESLPKVICAVVDFERKRLNPDYEGNELYAAFPWRTSNIFGNNKGTNSEGWTDISEGEYEKFYSIFPTCKNSRGQELPEEIQVEIVEERLRLGKKDEECFATGYFNWLESAKGNDYWGKIFLKSDYTPTELPTKSDDTFTQGEIVEVRDSEGQKWAKREYVSEYKGCHICFNENTFFTKCVSWKEIRKIQPLELTLPELLTIAESVKGTKVKLKS